MCEQLQTKDQPGLRYKADVTHPDPHYDDCVHECNLLHGRTHPIPCLVCEVRKRKEIQEQNDQLKVQLAGCTMAAQGFTFNNLLFRAKPGDYGYSEAYKAAEELFAKWYDMKTTMDKLKQWMAEQSP